MRPPIAPVVWSPPKAPVRSRRPVGPVPLPPLTVIEVGGTGPEDVLVGDDGSVLTGLADGRILRIRPAAGSPVIELVADTGGRPLGLEWLPDGDLLVCDARRGLLRVEPGGGAVHVLLASTHPGRQADGVRLGFCNNAAVAPDGTVYFSDTSRHFGIDHWQGDLLEHSGTGRLLRLTPDGAVDVVADGLHFANGVALTADGRNVVVAETGAYRLTRIPLSGRQEGRPDVLVDNLPGFPDNISVGSDGLIWVALASPRDPLLDRLHGWPPVLRRLVWSLPDRFVPGPTATVWAMAFRGEDGGMVHDLQGSHPAMHMVTGVREQGGILWLGSLHAEVIAALTVPDPPSSGRSGS